MRLTPSPVDHTFFSPYVKVRFRHERSSMNRLWEAPTPAPVACLVDWVYSRVLHRSISNTDEAGAACLNKDCHVRVFLKDVELQPWNFVPPGAFITLRRCLFTDDMYSVPPWSLRSWEAQQLSDLQRIRSYHAWQAYDSMVQADLRRTSRRHQLEVAEGQGRIVAKRPPKRVLGIMSHCMREAATDGERHRAMLSFDGKLVVHQPDRAAFDHAMSFLSPSSDLTFPCLPPPPPLPAHAPLAICGPPRVTSLRRRSPGVTPAARASS